MHRVGVALLVVLFASVGELRFGREGQAASTAPLQPTDSSQPHPCYGQCVGNRELDCPSIQWSVPVQLGLQALPLHLRRATFHLRIANSRFYWRDVVPERSWRFRQG